MSGIDRKNRNYKTQEVFTPDWMVEYSLREIPEYLDLDSVCLDRAVGDGQFLSKILIDKMLHFQKNGMAVHESFVVSLDSIFGVDIERENVDLCRQRLLCGCSDPEIISLVERRILLGDCLNPNKRIDGQTDQDHILMKKYFGLSISVDIG